MTWAVSQVSQRQIRTVSSYDFEASKRPSDENETQRTVALWPTSWLVCLPLATSQTRTVRSCEADASNRPSGDQAMWVTRLECPQRMRDESVSSELRRAKRPCTCCGPWRLGCEGSLS